MRQIPHTQRIVAPERSNMTVTTSILEAPADLAARRIRSLLTRVT
ncbi:MAG TPA: hypothetical protein VK960_00680 [Acidimicrobiia bacterium]|nr:hypothetical protein [Acidimicrobiia bacterium]